MSTLAAVLLAAAAGNPFAYTLMVTPEEGPIDQAVQARYTPALAACQAKAQTTNDNAQCFVDEFTRQDAALNAAWPAALARVGAKAPALRVAQRGWVAARDPFCQQQLQGFAGGTIAPLAYASCRAELTIRRTMWLEKVSG